MTGKAGLIVTTRALLDNGSQVNLVTPTIVHQLGEIHNKESSSFVGVGGNSLGQSEGEVWLTLHLRDGQKILDKFYVVKNITPYSPPANAHKWSALHNKLADEHFNKPGKIHVLLGVGMWIKVIKPGFIRSDNKLAHESKLGYIVLQGSESAQRDCTFIGSVLKTERHNQLMDQIKKLWEIEEVPTKKKRTREEDQCEEVFRTQHKRDKSGRYIVRMPFNSKIKELGKSKRMAMQQFFAMENRMRKNKEFADKYRLFMSEYEALGHMEEIWEREEEGYYTPHHGVLSAAKFRVFSKKTTSNISLNEAQLAGEKLQNDLFTILINFRRFRFGITADIEKMYRQVLIHHDDQKYQKILWRSNYGDPIKVYRLKTVTYGQACAPHCAIRALMQCAADNEVTYPKGASIVKECFYVDDLLTGADTTQEAHAIKHEITELLKQGGFNITKWKTNSEAFESVELKDPENQTVLGLYWNLKKDIFFYNLREEKGKPEKPWTKRKILSRVSQLYDPNGYLGPVIMQGKIIIQELWKDQLEWDEEVKGKIKDSWDSFNNDLKNLHVISINRRIGTGNGSTMQIHGFCDASEKGYGAVIYSRVKEKGKYQVELIASKSRVAPVKVITIPRLELCAANLLVNLLEVVVPTLTSE